MNLKKQIIRSMVPDTFHATYGSKLHEWLYSEEYRAVAQRQKKLKADLMMYKASGEYQKMLTALIGEDSGDDASEMLNIEVVDSYTYRSK